MRSVAFFAAALLGGPAAAQTGGLIDYDLHCVTGTGPARLAARVDLYGYAAERCWQGWLQTPERTYAIGGTEPSLYLTDTDTGGVTPVEVLQFSHGLVFVADPGGAATALACR